MNHDEIKAKLNEFIDNELPEEQRREIIRHVASCPDCGRSVTDYRKAAAFFFARPEVRESESFVDRVMAALSQRGALPHPLAIFFSYLFQWRTAGALASILVLWIGFVAPRDGAQTASWNTRLTASTGSDPLLLSDPEMEFEEWAQSLLTTGSDAEVNP
jgi:anti-sigma factor RsiW